MFKKAALATTALTFFLLQPDPAAAGPLIGAIAGVFSAVISGSGIVNAVVSLALAAATTLWQMATAPDAPPPVGAKIQADVGDDKPVSTTIGQFATRGKRKYYGTWGNYDGDTPNTYFTEVIELGNLPLPGLDGIWIEGEKCTILWNEPDAVFGRGYPLKEFRDTEGAVHDYCWVKFYSGLHTVADPFLVETFGEDEDRPWDATMIGRGIPYAIMTYRWERDYFKGQPKVLFEPTPLPLYDIRKDSTNGGNGTHRWDDPSTHEPSYNLGVMTYNVLRGLRYKGEWFYGGQKVNARRLPSSNWIAACQEAGRLVERADKTTEPQWRGGYEISGDMVPLTVVEELRKAQNGRLTDQGGVFKMKNGIYGGAVFGFSDHDTLITEPAGFDPFPSVDLTINGVTAKYPNPEEAWVAKDAPVVRSDAFEALDGKRNLADISFGATSHDRQVQQLMRAILAEARRFRRHQLPLPPIAYLLEAGIDVVSWTSPHNGYVNKRFLVTERRGQMGMNQIVTLQEIDPTDYDWVRTMQEVVSSGWIGRIDVPTQPMTGWFAEPAEVKDADGRGRRPAIRIRCAANLADVKSVAVEVRLVGTTEVIYQSSQYDYQAATPEWLISGDWLVTPTVMEIRGKLLPHSSRKTEWSGWLTVSISDYRISLLDLGNQISESLTTLIDWINEDVAGQAGQTAADLIAETQARIAAIQAQSQALAAEALARANADQAAAQALLLESQARAKAVQDEATARSTAILGEATARQNALTAEGQARATAILAEASARIDASIEQSARYRSVLGKIDDLMGYISNADFAAFTSVQHLRTTLVAQIGDVTATFDQRITAAVSATSAAVERVTSLEAKTGDLSAHIVEVDQARVDGENALAAQIAAVSVGTLNQFDHASIWYFDQSVEDWTGNGAPSASGGFIRPADHATAPYLVSPSALAIDAAKYTQVRARIRMVGSPAWLGRLYWKGVGDTTWSIDRSVSINEPLYDDAGIANVTWNATWAGVISQIRIDISGAQSAGSAFDFDWIGIGRPSPGASAAELLAERQARISALSALASETTALQAELTSAALQISGVASGVSALESRVEEVDETLTAQTTALTGVQAGLAGKAGVDVVNTLTATVQSIGTSVGALLAEGSATTAIRTSLVPLMASSLNRDLARFMETQKASKAAADASQTLSTRIEATNDTLSILSQAMIVVRSELPGLAKAQAVVDLTSRVTVTEQTIEAQSTLLTAITAELEETASASALTELAGNVTRQSDQIVSLASATTAVRNRLEPMAAASLNRDLARFIGTQRAMKIAAEATQSLSTEITATNDNLQVTSEALTKVTAKIGTLATADAVQNLTGQIILTSEKVEANASAITQVMVEIADKASGSALFSLSQTVEQQGANISAQGQAITSLTGEIAGKASGSAVFSLTTRMTSAEGVNTSQGNAITSLQNDLGGKASAGAVSELQTKVTEQGGVLASQGLALTNVQGSLAGKADASALSSLSSTVSQQGSALSSQSQAITSLQNEIVGKASASALASLTTRMTSAEGVNTSQGNAISSLQNDIVGKASGTALSELRNVVTEQSGLLSSQGNALTSLQNTLPGKADATALSSLSNTVAQQGTTLTSQGEAITLLRNSLPGKADASAVTTLSTAVTQQGDTLSTQGAAITALQNAISGKADVSALSTLTTKVNEQGNTLTSQGSALTSVQATLGGKANTSDVNSALAGKTSVSTTSELIGYVGYVEGVVASHGTAITNLQSEITGKASASAVSTLSSKVTEQAGQLSATASSITNLTASMNGITANARLKAEVVSGPSGFSRIGFMASSESNGHTRTSGLYIDVPNDTSQPAEVIVDASRFAVIDGTSKKDLFAVVNGQTVITAAFIPVITTDRIIFGDGSIQETAMGQNATGERKFFASVDDVTLGASFTNLGAVTISKNDADYIEVDAVIRMQSSAGGTGLPTIEVALRQSSTEVDSQIFRFSTVGELQVARLKYMVDSGNGSRTYSIIARVLSGNVFVGRRSLAAKRDKKSNA